MTESDSNKGAAKDKNDKDSTVEKPRDEVRGSNSNATQEVDENPNESGDFNSSEDDKEDHTDFAFNERGLDREEEQDRFLGTQTREGAPSPSPTDVGSVGEKLE